jgi:TRAP-type C4-dicarboxylate transport system permease large subunit
VTGLTDAVGHWVTGLALGTIPTLIVVAGLLFLLGSVLDGLALMLRPRRSFCPWWKAWACRRSGLASSSPARWKSACPSATGHESYVIQGVAKRRQHQPHLQGVMPFLASDLVLLLILFPAMALWLPGLFGQ